MFSHQAGLHPLDFLPIVKIKHNKLWFCSTATGIMFHYLEGRMENRKNLALKLEEVGLPYIEKMSKVLSYLFLR